MQKAFFKLFLFKECLFLNNNTLKFCYKNKIPLRNIKIIVFLHPMNNTSLHITSLSRINSLSTSPEVRTLFV
jgi:hypothetical protein